MKAKKLLIYGALGLQACNYGGIDIDTGETSGSEPVVERLAVKSVTDYSPAPGQYVNLLPPCSLDDDIAGVRLSAAEYLNRGWAVTLGAFGGNITLELNQPIARIAGKPEFFIGGNAISNSSEPGIVEVSADGSRWFILRGEIAPDRIVRTEVTYAKIPGSENIAFVTDNEEGILPWLPQYHSQCYWPLWICSPEITFSGLRLPDNATLNSATGKYEFKPYYGYADSYPNSSPLGYLNLDNATDPDTGETVEVDRIKFIRITTAILQINGALGESSTEVSGVYLLSWG